jgi:NitT/TauT family transport system substrate-binding protein
VTANYAYDERASTFIDWRFLFSLALKSLWQPLNHPFIAGIISGIYDGYPSDTGEISMLIQRLTKLGLSLLIGLAACAPPASAITLTPITVQLSWTHQAQFGGWYDADQKGYYAQAGLAVRFREGGPNVDALALVLDGTVQFGLAKADALIAARAEGKSLRAIATIYRRSPEIYITLASSGLVRPQDFVGKTIEVSHGGLPLLHALTSRVGIAPDQYTTVERTDDLTAFYSGQVQVRSVFLMNEVLMVRAAGYKLNLIYPDDYNLHFYADTLFARDDLIANQPDLVLRFLNASLQGWTEASENPRTTGALVSKYNPTADVAHENAVMIASLPLINTGEDHIGWMKPSIWADMDTLLREQGVITRTSSITDVYTLQFLNAIYSSP